MSKENEKLNVEMVGRIMANPFYAINIAAEMCMAHEPLIDEDTFVKVGMECIKQDKDGGERYLRDLLENLKGNYVENPDERGIVDGFNKV